MSSIWLSFSGFWRWVFVLKRKGQTNFLGSKLRFSFLWRLVPFILGEFTLLHSHVVNLSIASFTNRHCDHCLMFCSDLGSPWGGLKLWGRTTLFRRSIYLWFWRCLYVSIGSAPGYSGKFNFLVTSHTRCLSLLPFWPRGIRHHRPFFRALHLNLTIYSISQKHDFNIHDGHEKLRYWCRSSLSDSREPNFGKGKVPRLKLFRRLTHDESFNRSRKVSIPP